MPRIPAVDTELCNHCGYCAVHCPASAIKKGDECYTDVEKCIRCCACVKGCPQKLVHLIRHLPLCLPIVSRDRKKTGLSYESYKGNLYLRYKRLFMS